MRTLRLTGLLITGTLGVTGFGHMAVAADVEPGCVQAVSQLNGKLSAAGGYIEDGPFEGERTLGVGSLSFPLGCLIGAQIDVGGGTLDGDGWFGAGAHLFLRDPEQYLIGVHGQYIDLDGEDVFRIGPEFEFYADMFTISGWAAFESEDFNNFNTDDFIAVLEGGLYITDNFRLNLGYRHFLDVDAGAAGFEFQPEAFPVSFFADGMVGSDDFAQILGGIRIYFGGDDKSLKARHREDDPPDYFNLLRHESEAVAVAPPPPTDAPKDSMMVGPLAAGPAVE
jgi:hypothetical protein